MGYRTYSQEEKLMYGMIKTAETIEKYEELKWPEIEGTDKQRYWAMSIKIKAVEEFKKLSINDICKYVDKSHLYGHRFINYVNIIGIEQVREKFTDFYIKHYNHGATIINTRHRCVDEIIKLSFEQYIEDQRGRV